MIVVANRIYVAPGSESAFEERFRTRPRQVEQAAGFIRNEVLRPISEGSPYVVLTHWQDEACFRSWTESPAFRVAHASPRPPEGMFSQPNAFEMHEVLLI